VNWRSEWKPLVAVVTVFLAAYHLPVGNARFDNAIHESLELVKWYAREHVVLCLIPAFFIAGAISVFISQASVMKYLGAGAKKTVAYGVASVSGGILAVCSCTVLPLFAGIYRMGAGLGPATAFLYAGPAINVLAIILTARILGVQIGIARAIGAVVFSIVIGLLMYLFFRREEEEKVAVQAAMPEPPATRPLWQTVIYFASMVAILVFANWGQPEQVGGFWSAVYGMKWWLTGAAAVVLAVVLVAWFGVGGKSGSGEEDADDVGAGELAEWLSATWGFAKQITPLLLLGVLVAGLCLGRPGHEGLIPSEWVARAVGGNSLGANLFASFAGAFMYFATLTEVPILQGLLGAGMGQGPALALLLAGPALSLPSILVLYSIMGLKKTAVFIVLVMIMATISGLIYGAIAG